VDASATAAAAQAPPAKRGRGRPRKQAAAGDTSSGGGSGGSAVSGQPSVGQAEDPALRRQSPMEAMPFLDRALGVLDMGEAGQRAAARVRSKCCSYLIDASPLVSVKRSRRRGSGLHATLLVA
jgi:hypothetical protein